MKRVVMFVCMLLGLFANHARAGRMATCIEQKISSESVSGQTSRHGTQKIWFTRNKVRNETTYGDRTSVALFDLEKRRVVLMPGIEKQYIELDLDEYQEIMAMRLASAGLGDPRARPELANTGEQKKIGQWNCVKYIYRQEGDMPVRSVLWISTETGVDFATYVELMKTLGLSRMLGGLADMVESLDGWPIRVESEQSVHGQKIVSYHEVTGITKMPVEKGLFSVPDGYERIQDDALERKKSKNRGAR